MAYKIKTQADLEEAISYYNTLAGRREKILGKEKAELSKIRQKTQAEMLLRVDGKDLTICDRLEEIRTAAEKYCAKHPEAAEADGKRSRNYPAGIVGYRQQPAKLVVADKEPFKKLAAKWLEKVMAALARITAWKGRKVDTLVKIKIEPDLTPLKKERAAGTIKDAELKKLGLKYEPEYDLLFIEGHQREMDR